MMQLDSKALKLRGFFQQSNGADTAGADAAGGGGDGAGERYSLRLALVGGTISSEMLRQALAIADTYGTGRMHLTTRQQLEIHDIAAKDIPAVEERLAATGLRHFKAGPVVRSVVACVGKAICRFGRIDTTALATTLAERFVGRALPGKCKIAVTGCPNNCAKIEATDIGIRGAAKGTYALFVGGAFGKTPRMGVSLIPPVQDAETLVRLVGVILEYYAAHAETGERLGALLDRIGSDGLRAALEAALAG